MSVKNPSAASRCILPLIVAPHNMISTCPILEKCKSLKQFRFVADYGRDKANERLVFLDIIAFEQAGLGISAYRKLFRVQMRGNELTGATVCGSLQFDKLC